MNPLIRPRQYLHIVTIVVCCWVLLQCSYPTDVPAQSALPDAFRHHPISNAIVIADSLSLRGEYHNAFQAYQAVEETLTIHSDVPEADLSWLRLKMARILIQNDQPIDAEALLDTILSKTPKSKWAIDARIEKGRRLQSLKLYNEALTLYLEAFNSDPNKSDGYLAFRIALCYQNVQQFEKAIIWYDQAKTHLPVLADYTHYFSAECLKVLNRTEDVREHLIAIKDSHPHSPFQNTITPEIYESYLDNKHYTKVINEIRLSMENSHWEDAESNAALLIQKATAFEALGEPDSVRSMYRTLLAHYRFTQAALDIITPFKQLSNRLGVSISDEESLWIGLVYLNQRQYGTAKVLFLDMVKEDVEPWVHPEVLYYLNRIRYIEKSYKTAQVGFKQVVEAYPDHPKAALASFHIARCIRARFGILTSLDAYDAFAAAYPSDDNAPDALLFIAEQYFNRHQFGKAAAFYHKIAHNYPEYEDRNKAHWQEGYAYYRAKNYKKSAEVYLSLAKADSISTYAARGLYWAGKAYQKNNQLNTAKGLFSQVINLYPRSYYAHRAMQQINAKQPKPERTYLTGWQREDDFRSDPPAIDLIDLKDSMAALDISNIKKRDTIHYTRAAALFELGLRKEGVAELEWYRSENSHNPQALTDVISLYYTYKYYREGIRAASRLQRQLSETNRLIQVPWQFIYPAPFWNFIQAQSERLKLDPLFILAVMRQESRFDHEVKSWAGAYGLMQLMPVTARSLAKQQRIKNYSLKRLLEPSVNITLGSNYLVELLRRFKGRPELVLAGYNGGPSRVSRWMRQRGSSDIDEFVEEINLEETKLFVKLVMNNYAQYVTQSNSRLNTTQ